MTTKHTLLILILLSFIACNDDSVDDFPLEVSPRISFNHYWDDTFVTNSSFNSFQFTNENGELLSIERLRYVVSDIKFTNTTNETIEFDSHHLVDVTNSNNLGFTPETAIPAGSYTVSFTFGLDNEDNSKNYLDLNSESFNVPDMMGGGYHYMQFDGKFINTNNEEQGFNYHAIRAVDDAGLNPTFPQDTFFEVNLGVIDIVGDVDIRVNVNIAEWFKNPNTWNLNEFNQMLMPNSTAQIMMFQNGQNVFSLGSVVQYTID